MIPLKIELENFLSFRAKETLEFGPGVTMLSGPNGSGKSSVFDGFLVGLFGGSRLGKKLSADLIHAGTDLARVALEFDLGGERYRVERTLSRTGDSYKQQAMLKEWDGKKNEFRPVKQGSRIADCDKKLAELLGMSFDGFTTSVLLLQGKAETLLNQDTDTAEIRFKALSAIVGLEFYAALHKRAETKLKELKVDAAALSKRLELFPEVTDEQIQVVVEQMECAERDVKAAEEGITALEQIRGEADCWQRVSAELRQKKSLRDSQDVLIADAATIQRDGERFADLQAHLPLVGKVLAQRQKHSDAERDIKEIRGEEEKINLQRNEVRDEMATNADRVEELLRDTAGAQTQRDTLTATQAELSPLVSPLRRVRDQRKKLIGARNELATLTGELTGLEADESQKRQEFEMREQAVGLADETHHDAQLAETTAETELNGIRDRRQKFETVAGGQTCSWCGSELTDEHAERERLRIAELLEKYEQIAVNAMARRTELGVDLQKVRQAAKDAKDLLQTAETNVRGLRERIGNGHLFESGCNDAIVAAWSELPPDWQANIAVGPSGDWTTTTFPSAIDLTGIETTLTETKHRLDTWRTQQDQREKDRVTLQAAVKKLTQDGAGFDEKLKQIGERLAVECERQKAAAEQMREFRDLLPASWRVRLDTMTQPEFAQLEVERDRLTLGQACERWDALKHARDGRAALDESIIQLVTESEKVPEPSRRPVEEIDGKISVTRRTARDERDIVVRKQIERDKLQEQREERADLAEESKRADRGHLVAKTFADLIGPRQLQKLLIWQAEEAIVINANRVLDHLSSGGLSLLLVDDEDNIRNKALQLKVKKADGRTYSIISGSEKFRVAISLALGIGQFASTQHRRIETVIIDEGFGCLDRENRDTMIEEIDGLIGELKCVLLVSHLEEFAQRFTSGYSFRMEDNATKVTRRSTSSPNDVI